MELTEKTHLYFMNQIKHIMKRSIILLIMLAVTLSNTRPAFVVEGRIISADTGIPVPGVKIQLKGTSNSEVSDTNGEFNIQVPDEGGTLVFTAFGFSTKKIKVSKSLWLEVKLRTEIKEPLVYEEAEYDFQPIDAKRSKAHPGMGAAAYSTGGHYNDGENYQNWNTEEYATIHENIFLSPVNKPLSTFSIDVDAASYSNIRRFINNGQKPPIDAVRIEEMINYFNYTYQQPEDGEPFTVHSELSYAPWNPQHKLLHIGLKGIEIPKSDLPASNLVFLIDVSGSMSAFNKLPLLKSSFKLLVNELRPQDRVAIVVYAGAAGVVLSSTAGIEKARIIQSLDNLNAGGSTAGGAGIRLAYNIARENFIERGNNRVILATDGDFNIGESSNAAMERLIADEKESGIFLTVLGFGMGNYKDSKMEILADKGNGNYAYIDTMKEAQKVLQKEFGGTLFTIAKDVKIQIEFNPDKVQAYRLLGYENRILLDEDFNNDKKDSGDLGSGHTVTALYEIIPVGIKSSYLHSVDELKYQSKKSSVNQRSTELVTIKLRYKLPDEDQSSLITEVVHDGATAWKNSSENFRWAAAVATFGMILRDSEYRGQATCNDVISWAESAKGPDVEGYRHEFIQMVETCNVFASR